MKNYFYLIAILAAGLVACDDAAQVVDCIDGCSYIEERVRLVPGPSVDPIKVVVEEENKARADQGQSLLSPGLSCTVRQVSSGSRISSSSPSGLGPVVTLTGTEYKYTYIGSFNQPNASGSQQNNVLPPALRPLFVGQNYLVRCVGLLVVTESNFYNFNLHSDDGSILTVDNTVVINNDGNHGMTSKTGTIYLKRGARPFKLEYAQTGGGNFGLILTAGGSLIDPLHYYR